MLGFQFYSLCSPVDDEYAMLERRGTRCKADVWS